MKRIKILPLVNAIFFALFVSIGSYLDKYHTILTMFNTSESIKKVFLQFLILILLFYTGISLLYKGLDKKSERKAPKGIFKFLLYDHPFALMSITAIGISLLYLYFFYPGVLSYDGKWQINSFFHYWTYNDHHPALLSAFMGALFQIGTLLIDNNFGIFLYIVPQLILNGIILGYTLKMLDKMEAPFFLRILTFLFYGFFPYWQINSITFIKDTVYYLLFLLIFVYQYYHFGIRKEKETKSYIKLMILYFLLYLFRNTGFYIGLITCLFFFLYYKKEEKRMSHLFFLVACSILLFHLTYHKVFLPTFQIEEGMIREKLSIPLQQTARYIKYYGEEITDEEKEGILTLFRYDIKSIGSSYNPYRSDDVKTQIKDYPTKNELKAYFSSWYSMFKRHPEVYVDATLNNTYGYLYSEHRNFMGEEIGFYDMSENKHTNVYFQEEKEEGRTLLKNMARNLCETKGIGLLYSCYFYIWILLFLSFYCLHKKYYKLVFYFIPLYLTVLLCFISPVNGHMRYLFPVAISIPVALVMVNQAKREFEDSL